MTPADAAELHRLLRQAADELAPTAARNVVEHLRHADELLVVHLPTNP